MSLTSTVFALAFFAGLGMALLRHPMYGLFTYIAVFYLHPPSKWWAADLPDLRWALVASAVTLLATYRLPVDAARPSWIATTPGKILVIFTAWLWLQNLWALDPDNQLEVSILYTKYVVLFYVIYRLVDTPEKISSFFIAHIAGCFYLGLLAFNARFAGRLESVGGPGINEANALGMQMATAVVMGAMLILRFGGWRRWLTIAAMPFILNTLVLTGSRSAFLGLLAGALVLTYLKPLLHRRLFYAFAALGVLLSGALAHETFWERMSTIGVAARESDKADRSSQIRVELAKAQLQMAQRYPFGAGHRGTAVLSPSYLDPTALAGPRPGADGSSARSSHNTFLTVLVEQGLPGAFMFSVLVVWFARRAMTFRKLTRDPEVATLSALAAGFTAAYFIVHASGIFVDYLKAEVQIWCLALAASAAILAEIRQVGTAGRRNDMVTATGPRSARQVVSRGGRRQ